MELTLQVSYRVLNTIMPADFFHLSDPEEGDWLYLGSTKTETEKRLEGLALFQTAMINHCLKCTCTASRDEATSYGYSSPCLNAVPRVKRVVYSTCSIHEEENEMVVQKVLADHPYVSLVHVLPQWPRRGHPIFDGGTSASLLPCKCLS